ncbi:unnamed protein product [Rotaria socialis]
MGFLSATVEAQGVLTATFPQLLFLAFYCLSKLTARYTTTTVSLIFECNSSHTTSTSVRLDAFLDKLGSQQIVFTLLSFNTNFKLVVLNSIIGRHEFYTIKLLSELMNLVISDFDHMEFHY